MPYLRVTCAELETAEYAAIARELTHAINDLFYNPKARLTREELRERTTVHFIPYGNRQMYIGASRPSQRGRPEVTIELSDWSMSVKQQRKIAARLTPVFAGLFGV